MNMILALSDDSPLWVIDNSSQPIISISQETVEEFREFERTHPDVPTNFVFKEVKAALHELLFRLDRESHGDA